MKMELRDGTTVRYEVESQDDEVRRTIGVTPPGGSEKLLGYEQRDFSTPGWEQMQSIVVGSALTTFLDADQIAELAARLLAHKED